MWTERLAQALCAEFSINAGLPLGEWDRQTDSQRKYWRERAQKIAPILEEVIEQACRNLRGFDGEPGNAGEMIAVNYAQELVRDALGKDEE